MYDVSWDEYSSILDGRGDRRFHHTYDQGRLEIMSPSRRHEWEKSFLGRAIETIAYRLDIEIECLGNATHRREDLHQGLEPDECYYIANEPLVRDHVEDIDLTVDPPPDLVVEVDVTSSSIERIPIYAALGVPEVWQFDGEKLRIHLLDDAGQYRLSDVSLSFPFLPAQKLTDALTATHPTRSQRIRQLVDWAVTQFDVEDGDAPS